MIKPKKCQALTCPDDNNTIRSHIPKNLDELGTQHNIVSDALVPGLLENLH